MLGYYYLDIHCTIFWSRHNPFAQSAQSAQSAACHHLCFILRSQVHAHTHKKRGRLLRALKQCEQLCHSYHIICFRPWTNYALSYASKYSSLFCLMALFIYKSKIRITKKLTMSKGEHLYLNLTTPWQCNSFIFYFYLLHLSWRLSR